MRPWRNILLLAAVMPTMAAAASAQTVIPVGPFRSLAVHNGVEVLLRHGAVPGVNLLQGDRACVRVAVESADRLVIERLHGCPGVHDLKLEVTVPEIGAVSVSDGGTVRSLGDFPPQQALQCAVANGGSLDLRALKPDYVTAAVESGGRIFARSDGNLLASIAQGGVITYWGNAKVQSSIAHGGIVTRGKAADADKPFEAFAPAEPVPVTPVSPVLPTSY